MLEMIFIRHAATRENGVARYQGARDTDLSRQGVAESVILGWFLETDAIDYDGVWSSDLGRAWRTAELAFPRHRPVRDPRLRELDFGQFDGLTFEENLERHGDRFREWLADPRAVRPPEGETLEELEARLDSWLRDLPECGRVAVVTHAGPIHVFLARALGLSVVEARRRFVLKPCHAVRMQRVGREPSNGSLHYLEHLRWD